jgi:hypothetical protein
MNCFKDSIQTPGLGRNLSQPGNSEKRRYGNAIPSAKKVKTVIVTNGGCVIANPRADPIKGAVQGVANIVAAIPLMKDPE